MAAKKSSKANIVLQYGDRSISYDELVQNMKNKWIYDVKPEEDRVYYVINESEENGSFGL